MKQLLQDARSGQIEVAEVPPPKLLPGCVLVKAEASLVSAGTERAASEFARKNIFQKAQSRPDLVRQVVEKVKRDGLFAAVQTVRSRLDQPLALGYSSAGTVLAVGEGINDLHPGDCVACAGAGFAVHAELACVPRLLVAKIPDASVSFESAAFTTLGAVALHGIRTAEAKLGDVVAVLGLGLLGQLAAQLLKAAGCRVIGLDIAQDRAELAKNLGADFTASSPDIFRELCRHHSNGYGVDSIIITAETAGSELVNLGAEVIRDRGIVTAVGTVGMNIERKLYYAKELDFRLSRSYGPGRYDAAYEQKGKDYPIGYVRWTENRNMEAFLQLLSNSAIHVEPLVTHRFDIQNAQAAYDLVAGKRSERFLGILLQYPNANIEKFTPVMARGSIRAANNDVRIGIVGAGTFATDTLLPALKKVKGIQLSGVCSATGIHARQVADKFGFHYCTTAEAEVLNDSRCNAVVIATRNHLHATQVLAAMRAGKHVFCEKPLCTREEELEDIIRGFYGRDREPLLMAGFNRRFAPMAVRLKQFFSDIHEPLAINYRINAGLLPRDHWVNDPDQGGGRIIGELCHFVDLVAFIGGSQPVQVHAHRLASQDRDTVNVFVHLANGSQANISYLANGDRGFSKERLEVFAGGATGVLEDFRRLDLSRHGRRTIVRSRLCQDKGHRAELQAFVDAVKRGSKAPVDFAEIVATTLATFRIRDSVALGKPVSIDVAGFIGDALKQRPAGSVPA